MTKMRSYLLILVLVVSMVFAGCSTTKTLNLSEPIHKETNTTTSKPSDSNSNTVQSDLVGFVTVEDIGSDTNVTYTFKNDSGKRVTVIGGASYKLLSDNNIVEEGGVPIKDYIDLEPGEKYTDTKTFSNLQTGSYSINVTWNKTMVTANFVRN